MRVIYEPVDLIDAYLVKGVLEREGIPVFVRGEHLLGGVGQLPAIGLLALCVPEPWEEQASAALQGLEQARVAAADAIDAGVTVDPAGLTPAWAIGC